MRQVGQDRLDAAARDVRGQIEPVRADVADGRGGPALLRHEAPGKIRRPQQPVLQLASLDESHAA